MVTKTKSYLVELESGNTLDEHLAMWVNAEDYGASPSNTAADNTNAINEAIAATTSGFVLVSPGVSYTEASLVMSNDVTLMILGATGTVKFLCNDFGSSPSLSGGLVLKQQGQTGVVIRAVDNGVSAEPILQVVSADTPDIAATEVKFVEMAEITDPAAPSANKVRLYCKDDGGGNTKVMARFATGSPVVLNPDVTTVIEASTTYDPGSLANAAGVTTTVTCAGAALGDVAVCSFSLDLQGITMTSYVSAADTVAVRFQNESQATVDLASGTLYVRIL